MKSDDNLSSEERSSLVTIQEATTRLHDLRQALAARRQLRDANLNPTRLEDDDLKKLDSSVKRNTALIKRLRLLSEDARESLLEDIGKVNQSKYVSEAVAAISDAPLKARDVNAALQVCSVLHQRYRDFAPGLIPALSKVFGATPKGTSDDDKSMMLKKRGILRLMAELMLVGVYTDAARLLSIVSDLAAVDFQRDRESAQNNMALLAAFAKWFKEEYLGISNSDISANLLTGVVQQDDEPQPLSESLVAARSQWHEAQSQLDKEREAAFHLAAPVQQQFLGVIEGAFHSGCASLVAAHQQLQETERSNAHVLDHRGELPDDLAHQYEKQRKWYEGLYRSLASLSELLDRPLPDLPDSAVTRVAAHQSAATTEDGSAMPSSPFEDEETRAFYESLPDLRALVPAVLLQGGGQHKEASSSTLGEEEDDATGASAPPQHEQHIPASTGPSTTPASASSDSPVLSVPSATASELDALLTQISSCVTRERCDEWCVNFCFLSSRGARRKMVRLLCDLHTGGMHMMTYYARIAATLGQVFPDIPTGVVKHLEEEISTLLQRKDHTSRGLEARLRVMRYLAEMTKFKLLPYGTVFSCLKSLLDEFRDQNVDMAATLVETAGRYLYLLPETHTRMANMTEVMMKLKNARNLDARQSMVVDAAYFQCKPPGRAALRIKQRPPYHEYIRHLIYERLDKGEVQQVVRKLRRLSWPDHAEYVVKCILKGCRKGRFSNIPRLASMTAALSKYHSSVGVRAVDELVEAVRDAVLEESTTGSYQFHVAELHLLGEMYNYRLIDSKLVFDALYFILTAGYDTPEEAQKVDPPFNYFRIRLVAALMDSCGQYFTKGSARKRLDRFLMYFQRYILSKPPLAVDVEFDVQDLFEKLRPDLDRFTTFEEAAAAVAEVEAAEAAAALSGEVAADGGEDSDSEGEGEGRGENNSEKSHEEDDCATEDEDDTVEQPEAMSDDSDDVALLLQRTQQVERDEQFESEYAMMMAEYEGGVFPSAHVVRPPPSSSAAAPPEDVEDSSSSMTFKVLMKRGGRDDKSHQLDLPASATMAVNLRTKAAQEANEKALMKKLVLEANRRDEQCASSSSGAAGRHKGGAVILRTGRTRAYH